MNIITIKMWHRWDYTTSIKNKQQASKIHVHLLYSNDIGEVPPLHYHVSDATGHTVEVSFKEGEVVIKDNPIGVLTNHPDLIGIIVI